MASQQLTQQVDQPTSEQSLHWCGISVLGGCNSLAGLAVVSAVPGKKPGAAFSGMLR